MWLDSLQVNMTQDISVRSFDTLGEEVIIRNEIYFEMFWLPEEVKWDQSFCPKVNFKIQTIKGQKEIGAGIS